MATLQSMVDLQVVIPAYYFNCSGNVTEWRAHVGERQQNYRIEFQVWEHVAEVDCYTLVGANEFMDVRSDNNHRIVLAVPVGDQIQVKSGYVVGLLIYLGRGSGIQLDIHATDISVEYHDDGGGGSDDEGGESASCHLLQRLTTGGPVITAIVGKS